MVDEDTAPSDDGSSEADDAEIWADLQKSETSQDDAPETPAAVEAAPTEEPEAADPWATAPDALRTAHEALRAEHDAALVNHKRVTGSIPAQNRKINELIAENERLKAAQAAPEDDGGPEEPAEDPEDLVQGREEYPEVVGPLERKIDEAVAGIRKDVKGISESQAKTAEREAAEQDQRNADYQNQQVATIAETHPDWSEVSSSPAFHAWKDAQSPMTQRTIAESQDARDVIEVLDKFKASGTAPKPTATDAKREAQIASAETPKPGGPPVIVTEAQPEDDQAIWDNLAKDERRLAAGR